MPRWLRRCLYALVAILVAAAIVVGAWAVDANAHDGKVLRNVTLAGRDVSDLTMAVRTHLHGRRRRVRPPPRFGLQ